MYWSLSSAPFTGLLLCGLLHVSFPLWVSISSLKGRLWFGWSKTPFYISSTTAMPGSTRKSMTWVELRKQESKSHLSPSSLPLPGADGHRCRSICDTQLGHSLHLPARVGIRQQWALWLPRQPAGWLILCFPLVDIQDTYSSVIFLLGSLFRRWLSREEALLHALLC